MILLILVCVNRESILFIFFFNVLYFSFEYVSIKVNIIKSVGIRWYGLIIKIIESM